MSVRIDHITRLESGADEEALCVLLRSCVEQGASIGFMLPVEEEAVRGYWTRNLSELSLGTRLLWVARDDAGRIVGSVQLALETRRNGRHRAEVQKLMVLPGARLHGTGAALMGALETEASSRGLRVLFLDTSEGPAGARVFYEKLGYTYVGGIPGYALDPDGSPSKNAIYYKELSRRRATGPASSATVPVIRPLQASDWPEVKRIYEEGIATGHSTFQASAPESWEAFISSKVEGTSLAVLGEDGRCAGWAVLSPTSSRCVYAGVAELSIYLGAAARGRGLGGRLLQALVAASEAKGIWTLQSGTFPENEVSVRLQLANGFRIVGRREKVAKMGHGPWAGRWRDIYMLERRSTVVGT